MTTRLGGWWRLWIAVTFLYGCAVAAYTWMSWPQVSNIAHDSSFLKQLSRDAVAILERPSTRTLAQVEEAFIAADRAGATEKARALAQEIRRLREPHVVYDPITLEMPNGHQFTVESDTKDEQLQLVGREYTRVLQSVASERQLRALGNALLIWLVPSLIVSALGLVAAWVYRGFVERRREP